MEIEVNGCYADKKELKDGMYCFWEGKSCKQVNDCYYKQLQQLKAENEKLKQDLQKESDLGHKAMCVEADMAWEAHKLQKVLDEIEEVINKCQLSNCGSCKYYYTNCTSIDKTILNIIKQAKEGNNEN